MLGACLVWIATLEVLEHPAPGPPLGQRSVVVPDSSSTSLCRGRDPRRRSGTFICTSPEPLAKRHLGLAAGPRSTSSTPYPTAGLHDRR